MTLSAELLAELRALSHAEKLQVMQLLVSQLVAETEAVVDGAVYEIWSPFDAPEAAATLLALLEADSLD